MFRKTRIVLWTILATLLAVLMLAIKNDFISEKLYKLYHVAMNHMDRLQHPSLNEHVDIYVDGNAA